MGTPQKSVFRRSALGNTRRGRLVFSDAFPASMLRISDSADDFSGFALGTTAAQRSRTAPTSINDHPYLSGISAIKGRRRGKVFELLEASSDGRSWKAQHTCG